MTEETKTPKVKKEAEVVSEDKKEQKTETKKVEVKKEKTTREIAVANGFSLSVSTKHCVAICKMIMKKSPERAIEMLELVLKEKMAVPMRMAEIPHRRRGLMPECAGGGGRFPRNAAKEMIGLLKQLKANCEVGGVENPVITLAVSNLASRPFRREGRRAKRTHVHLEARDKTKLIVAKE
jgi:ribosomal protein L22